uniref:Uncharacterized protein n=1 Tax=Oncorhynchus tshawytscha TaxID=74940 RepID=A0A8C8M330_ONCTS
MGGTRNSKTHLKGTLGNIQIRSKTLQEVETNQLTQQIDIMTHTIQRERERAAELELRARLFNFGKYKSDDQEGMFDSLGVKVEEVYRGCVGDSEANLSTLQMLKAIESRLDELLEKVEIVPKERLVLAERAKEKERRFRLRDEKMHQDKQHQEERLKRALERAQADVKKTVSHTICLNTTPLQSYSPKLCAKSVCNITLSLDAYRLTEILHN